MTNTENVVGKLPVVSLDSRNDIFTILTAVGATVSLLLRNFSPQQHDQVQT